MSTSIRKQLWESMSDSPFLMIHLLPIPQHSEPMTAQLDKDAEGKFWFYTTSDNLIAMGGKAMAQYMSKDHKVFASISGNLQIETNPEIIDKFWSKKVAAWYKKGRQDPNLCMLRFDLEDAEVWTVDPAISGLFKMFIGKSVNPEEMGNHGKINL